MVRKFIFSIICMSLFFAIFTVFSYAQEDQPPQRLLILGDSIAAGYGVAGEESYAQLLADAKNFELSNFAFYGNDSVRLRWEVAQNHALRQAIVGADVIVISIGGNDFLLAEDGTLSSFISRIARSMLGDISFKPPIWDAFAERFAATITEIRALNPGATLIVQTVYNSALPFPSLRRVFRTAIGGINAGIYDYLEQHPNAFHIADIYTAFERQNGMIARDMVHPSAAGHAVIAHVLADVIAGTETPLPHATLTVDILILRPVFWLVDFLVRVGLWVLLPVFFLKWSVVQKSAFIIKSSH